MMYKHVYPIINLPATGARIKELREEAGVTVKMLQEFLGLGSAQAVYKWESGKCAPSIDNLYALSYFFGKSIDEILVGNRQDFTIFKINFEENRGGTYGKERRLCIQYVYKVG